MNKQEMLMSLIGMLLDSGDQGVAPTAKDLPSTNQANGRFEIGQRYLFRGVTCYQIGVVTKYDDQFVWLKDAGWLADTGRFSECIKNGEVSEFEKVPDESEPMVNIQSLCDVYRFNHETPDTK